MQLKSRFIIALTLALSSLLLVCFSPANATEVWLEEFNGTTIAGTPYGLTYVSTPTGKGAKFTRTSESRVQYPYSAGMPKSGTLEARLKIDSAYQYRNYELSTTESCALVFTTDVGGGDVTYPGSAWFSVCNNGDIYLTVATTKYGSSPAQSLVAKATTFRFGGWHTIGFSFGAEGQAIAIDGKMVASNVQNTQELGAGGNHSSPIDTPTLGESMPGFWSNNQWDGGFEGVVDTFRISDVSQDWGLGGFLTVSASKDTSNPYAVFMTCNITPPAGLSITEYAWSSPPPPAEQAKNTKTMGRLMTYESIPASYKPSCAAKLSNGKYSSWTTKIIHQVVHQTLDITPTVVDLAVTEIKIPLDADNDALPDSWENYGVKRYHDSAGNLSYKKDDTHTLLANLPLNQMGSDALCKDIFVEVDSMWNLTDDLPAVDVGHHHFLKASAMEKVRLAFFKAPVDNPQACGHKGIHLHIDHGSMAIMYVNPQKPDEKTLWNALYSRATILAHDEFISHETNTQDDSHNLENDFNILYKDEHFPIERRGVFHYAVSGHLLFEGIRASGVSLGSADTSMSASDFIITLANGGTENEQAGTFMHELGHNLGLYHGGLYKEGGAVTGDGTGFKPSHFSVMNYIFQFPGLSYYYNKQGVPVTDPTNGLLDYSRVTVGNDLDESSLNETNGVQIKSALSSIGLPAGFKKYAVSYTCGTLNKFSRVGQAIDWNCDGDLIDTGIPVDINAFKKNDGNKPNQTLKAPLSEWGKLVYTGSDVEARAIGGVFNNSTTVARQAKSVLSVNDSKREEVDIDTLRSMPAIHAVQVSGKAMLKVNVGRNYDLTYRLKNTGVRADSYKLETSNQANWQILSPIQQEISLEPNQSILLHVIVSVPSNLSDSAVKEVVTLRAISTTNENISDSVETRLQLE